MRTRIAASLFAVAVALSLAGCGTSTDRVREIDQTRFRAMVDNDLERLATLLADDLVYVHTDGVVESKEQFLRRLGSGSLRYRSIEPMEAHVRIDRNMAVVTGRSKMAITNGGSDREFEIRYTAVYSARSNHWQLVSWQSTRIQ